MSWIYEGLRCTIFGGHTSVANAGFSLGTLLDGINLLASARFLLRVLRPFLFRLRFKGHTLPYLVTQSPQHPLPPFKLFGILARVAPRKRRGLSTRCNCRNGDDLCMQKTMEIVL